MASRLVPVTADKVLDLWKAGLIVGEDGHQWRSWDSLAAPDGTLFEAWKDDLAGLMRFSPFVIVEDDTGE